MDLEQERQAMALFKQLIDVSPLERTQAIANIEDVSLREVVASLFDVKPLAFLSFPVGVAPEDTSEIPQIKTPKFEKPEVLGPYRIVDELGSGGMGAVYLADRHDGIFEQKVAIKVLFPGYHYQHLLERFRNEQQILASLNHPYIAHIFCGGLTDSGLPYYVMEYVEGINITDYCDQNQLSISERLILFQKVCEAIQFAHRMLIVHRDIKPANILVNREGIPKLLDFGIAKVLNREDPMTETGMRPMTREYASPEQIKGEDITTASDVYSLGVLLYEILTGRRPFFETKTQGFELEKAICEQKPMKPSVAVAHDVQTNTAIYEKRSNSPDSLRRGLRGDLDNIVMMALHNHQSRRYASVEQLIADLENYLHGMPVRAHAPSWRYRSWKFIRRNYGLLAIGLFVLFVGFHYSANIFSEKKRLDKRSSYLELEWENSKREAEFLIKLFGENGSSIFYVDKSNPKSLETLDLSRERLITDFKNESISRARLSITLARLYLQINDIPRALALAEDAVSIYKSRSFDEPLSTDAFCLHAILLMKTGEYQEAGKLLEKVYQQRQKWDYKLAEAKLYLGVNYSLRLNFNEAENLLYDALSYAREQKEPLFLSAVLRALSDAYLYAELPARALPYEIEALEIRRNALEQRDFLLAECLFKKGRLLMDMGYEEKGRQFVAEAMVLLHPKRQENYRLWFQAMIQLARYYYLTENHKEAISKFETLAQLEEQYPGQLAFDKLYVNYYLLLLKKEREPEVSKKRLKQVLTWNENQFFGEHPLTHKLLSLMAEMESNQ